MIGKTVENKSGILLDIGCGSNKQPRFVGMDKVKTPEVDIVHDLENFPWPLEDNSCLTVVGSKVIEYIKPWLTMDFFNECWRILKPDCQLVLSTPYAGSGAYWDDPLHCNAFTEKSFAYFDPELAPHLYRLYKPKPWRIESGFPVFQLTGFIEVIMTKRGEPTEDYLMACRSIELGAIQKTFELASLYELIKTRNLSTVVEIGTFKGGVFWGLCQLAKEDATIISIDMPSGAFGGGYTEGDVERYKTFGKKKQSLHFLREDSHKNGTKNKLTSILGKKKLDLLFIDGDHTYEGVKKDYKMYSPFVKKGGLIVFHDICYHPYVPSCKVNEFWNEIKEKTNTKEYIDPRDNTWGGIGVIEI